MPRLIGLISDTHGLLRPGVHTALAGVELILHAGDVGGDEILHELALIAPVRAVAGNCDDPYSSGLRPALDFDIDGVSVHISHGHEVGVPSPALLLGTYTADVIIYGHTHKSRVERHGSRLVINPGAAGPRRFNLRPTVGRLTLREGQHDVSIIELDA
jgi:hypothetical protein